MRRCGQRIYPDICPNIYEGAVVRKRIYDIESEARPVPRTRGHRVGLLAGAQEPDTSPGRPSLFSAPQLLSWRELALL